jgi:hypothetical protein
MTGSTGAIERNRRGRPTGGFFSKVLALFKVLFKVLFLLPRNVPLLKEHHHCISVAAATLPPPPPPCCRHHHPSRWCPCPLLFPLSLCSLVPAPSAAVAFVYIVIVIVSLLPFPLPLQSLLLVNC